MLDFSRFEILTFDCNPTQIHWEGGMLPVLHRILAAHAKTSADATLLKLDGDFEQRPNRECFQLYREVPASVVNHCFRAAHDVR